MALLRLLVVDVNYEVRKACREIAEGLGFRVDEVEGIAQARAFLVRKKPALLLLDVGPFNSEGKAFLIETKALYPDTVVIAMTDAATIASVVETMRSGAFDYLSKPFPAHVLERSLERAAGRGHFNLERRRLQDTLPVEMSDSLGKSAEMEMLYRMLSQVVRSTHPVMILGESGTGKELVARSIHSSGDQASKPFRVIYCESAESQELEGLIFGNSGVPSHARDPGRGLLTSTEGGTLFLDEVGDLPPSIQKRLADALTRKAHSMVDGKQAIPISVRVIAATSRNLSEMVRQGRFRMDLRELLSSVNLRIPPLRRRPEDIVFLANRFLAKIQSRSGGTGTLSDEVVRIFKTYDWPNNTEELEHTIGQAWLSSSDTELRAVHLPKKLIDFHQTKEAPPSSNLIGCQTDKEEPQAIIPLAEREKRSILDAIKRTNTIDAAAELLGIGKTTIYRKLKDYRMAENGDTDVPMVSSGDSDVDRACAQTVTNCA